MRMPAPASVGSAQQVAVSNREHIHTQAQAGASAQLGTELEGKEA